MKIHAQEQLRPLNSKGKESDLRMMNYIHVSITNSVINKKNQ